MADDGPIREGDRVVHLGAPGVFVVVARRGPFLHIESDRGLRKTVHEVAVRRLQRPETMSRVEKDDESSAQ